MSGQFADIPGNLSNSSTAVNFPMPQIPEPVDYNRRSTDLVNLTWREYLVRVGLEWFRAHGITGILLGLFLYASYQAIVYAATVGVPAAIAQIQAGYEVLGGRLDKIEATHEKQIDKLTSSIEKQATSIGALADEIRRERELRKRSSQ